MNKKTFLFIIQGEGRGHLTQAISIYEILKSNNMDLCCAVVGTSMRREIPDFFRAAIKVPVVGIRSPNFITDGKNKSVKTGKTILYNLLHIDQYYKSIGIIHKLIQFHKPDIVVNFYEPLAAAYNYLYPGKTRFVSVAHQFVYLHPCFRFQERGWLKKMMLITYSRYIASNADRILALSMYPLPSDENKKLQVIPPVIRQEVLQSIIKKESFILVYLVNSGYIEEIIQWHLAHPSQAVHCFTDCRMVKNEKNGEWRVDDTLTFHSLHDKKFLEMMGSCSGLATTAGFESVCEAMYLSKPVLMVPVRGQFEQICNALDAQKSGAGVFAESFNLSKLLHYIPFHNLPEQSFKNWVQQAENMIMQSIASLYPEESPDEPKRDTLLMRKVLSHESRVMSHESGVNNR